MAVRDYQDLLVWQKVMELCEAVYALTRGLPREEIYGLTQQMRRATISLPSNVAEGQGRGGDKEFDRFLAIAHGSLRELETQMILANRLGYVDSERTDSLLASAHGVGRLINGLRRKLKGGV